MTVHTFTPNQQNALEALRTADDLAGVDPELSWRRDFAIGAKRQVLESLVRRRLVIQRLHGVHFEWKITPAGRLAVR